MSQGPSGTETEAKPDSSPPRSPLGERLTEEELEQRIAHAQKGRRSRKVPFLRLLAYYLAVVAVLVALAFLVPTVREAFLAPINQSATASQGEALLTGNLPAEAAGEVAVSGPVWEHIVERVIITLLAVVGALALVAPVAWVYMFTKRLRYDPSLVQSVIILPLAVAGIVIIVKNSLALAFSLAGIVAAVRFRNTLKDPKDAVYIFLAISIGLASGVQALDVALVISLAFNLVVLLLWKYNVGAIYSRGHGPRGILSVGDRKLLVAREPEQRKEIRDRLRELSDGMKTDGVLLVHAPDAEAARHAVEVALSNAAKDWKLVNRVSGPGGLSTLEFLVRIRKKRTVVDLLGEIDDRWSSQVVAAEFVPLKTNKSTQ